MSELGPGGFTLQWGDPEERSKRHGRQLSAQVQGQSVGTMRLGLDHLESEPPHADIEFVSVDRRQRRRGIAAAMMREAAGLYGRLEGGPLSQDDPHGPHLRLGCWNQGLPIHDPYCDGAPACDCLSRLQLWCQEHPPPAE